MSVWLPAARYPDVKDQLSFFAELSERAGALPGVESVGFTSTLPFSGNHDRVGVRIDGRSFEPGAGPDPDRFIVTPDYLEAMRIPLIDGRMLSEADDASAPPVILISETMAKRLWPGRSPLGQRVQLPYSTAPTNPWRTVVGVVGDVRQYGLDRPRTMQIYLPMAQYPWPYMTLAARSRVAPLNVAADIRRQVRSLDPQQAVFDVATLESRLADSIALERFASWLIGGLAALALVLALVGIYGVVAYGVAQRTREYGLRLALGAQGRELLRLTLAGAAPLIGLGIALGIGLALALTRALQNLLFEITPTDVASFIAAPALVAGVALAACLLPARRAARVSPMTALRSE
jgi:putative ABC transport system permease protein